MDSIKFKRHFLQLLIFLSLSFSYANACSITPCLSSLTTESKITQSTLDQCVMALAEAEENASIIFDTIINELTGEEYLPIQRYFMSSDLIITLKPQDTISIYQRYIAMKKVLKKIIQKSLIEESQIVKSLDKLVLPCTFKAVMDSHKYPSKGLLSKMESHLIKQIHTQEVFHHSLRMNYAKYICQLNNNKLSDEIARYFAQQYPNQLSRMITTLNRNGRININITAESRDMILRTLFQQIEKENIAQSYQTIKCIESLTDLKFINKYLRFPGRDRHYKTVRKKALKYFRNHY